MQALLSHHGIDGLDTGQLARLQLRELQLAVDVHLEGSRLEQRILHDQGTKDCHEAELHGVLLEPCIKVLDSVRPLLFVVAEDGFENGVACETHRKRGPSHVADDAGGESLDATNIVVVTRDDDLGKRLAVGVVLRNILLIQFIQLGLDVLLHLNERATVRSSNTEQHMQPYFLLFSVLLHLSYVNSLDVTVDGRVQALHVETLIVKQRVICGSLVARKLHIVIDAAMLIRYSSFSALLRIVILVKHDCHVD